MQVLHLEPQGRCLNDANARRGRKPFRLSLQVLTSLVLSPARPCRPHRCTNSLPLQPKLLQGLKEVSSMAHIAGRYMT